MQQSGPNSEAGSHPPQPSPAATSPGPSLFLLTLPPSQGTAQEKSHPSIQPGHMLPKPLPLDASCQCIARQSLSALLHLHRPHHPSKNLCHPHPTHAKVVQGAHLCHGLKHCTAGDAVRDQPFAAPQC